MAYEVGTAFLQIVPSFRKIDKGLRQGAKQIADNLEKGIGQALPKGVKKGLAKAQREAQSAGEEAAEVSAGHFAETLNRRLTSAFRALPELELEADASKVERDLAKVHKNISELRDQKIGVDIDDATVVAAVNMFRERLRRLEGEATTVRLKVDVAQARDELDAWADMVAAGGERAAREVKAAAEKAAREVERVAERARRQAERAAEQAARDARAAAARAAGDAEEAFGHTWAGRVRKHVEDAFKSLPDVELVPARSAAQQVVKDLRAQLATLRDQRIGVDIDADDAVAVIAALRAQLVDLAKSDPSIQVQADTVAAAAELVAVERLAERLDDKDVDIQVGTDIDSAAASMRALGNATGLSLSRLESLVFLSLSLGTVLVPAAAAAAAAIGFIGTAAGAAAGGLGVMVLGFGGVANAVQALDKFQDDANKSAASLARSQFQVAGGTEAIVSAQRSLANVRANSADAARRAGQAVEFAERGVARAQEQARQASLDLVRAREEERRVNQDLAFDLEGLAIAQRQANLDQIEAKKELDKFLTNPRATQEQREQAQLTYDQIGLRIRELAVEQERLSDRQRRANELGVEGSDRVQAAQKRVRDTTEGVAESQRRLSEAILAQQSQQRQSAFALAQAQQSLAAAHRQVESASVRAGVAGGDALDTLNEAMVRLSPQGQAFARFIFGLKDEFLALRAAASNNMLPGVQAAIEAVLPHLPAFTRWVGEVAAAIGEMFRQTALFLSTDSTWRRFFGFIGDETVPTLERLYRIGRNVATGLAGLLMALSPFNDDIGGGLERLTERFARWATTLEDNAGFQKFLAYVEENGPKVVALIGEMTEFAGRFIIAAAPVGTVVMKAFTELFEALNAIPLPALTALVVVLATVTAGVLAMSAATRAFGLTRGAIASVGEGWKLLQGVHQAAMARYQAAMAEATIKTGQFGGALTHVQAGATAMGRGLSGMVGLLAGPLGIGVALTLAGLAVADFAQKAAEQKQRVDTLAQALTDLAGIYRDFGEGSERALQGLVRQNRGLQELIINAVRYGLTVQDIADAIEGDLSKRDLLARAYDLELDRLQHLLAAYKERQAWFGKSAEAQALLTEAGFKNGREVADRILQLRTEKEALLQGVEANARAQQAVALLTGSEKQAGVAADGASRAQLYLAESLEVLTSKTSTATEKADALRDAQDRLFGSAKNASEANEGYERSVDELTEAIARNGATLDVHSAAGRANRDAIQDRLQASIDMYNADIAAQVPIEEATRRHEERTRALLNETDQAKLDRAAVNELVKIYGQVPTQVETDLSVTGYDKVLKDLGVLEVLQYALRNNVPYSEALLAINAKKAIERRGMADGGAITGRGTKTSDKIPIWASDGEFMQRAAAVDYYGVPLMKALNERKIPREWLMPGFAGGGLVKWPFTVDARRTFVPTRDEAAANAARGAASAGGIGSARMMQLLRAVFPGLPLFSGYRPGSTTASGGLSYHAMLAADGSPGRAVDVPPRWDVFQWLRRNFPNSRELIFSPAGGQQIWNGRPHLYTGPVVAEHFDHVHWAYDEGGMLPPGLSTVYNGTGRPEPVLTDAQWRQISAAARGGDGSARVEHHWHFREAALDIDRLQAWQDRQDALARVGRPS